jgi:hypothetical protein
MKIVITIDNYKIEIEDKDTTIHYNFNSINNLIEFVTNQYLKIEHEKKN